MEDTMKTLRRSRILMAAIPLVGIALAAIPGAAVVGVFIFTYDRIPRFGPATRTTRRAENEGLSRSAVTTAEHRELVAGPIALTFRTSCGPFQRPAITAVR
jgi:hypothetical protein